MKSIQSEAKILSKIVELTAAKTIIFREEAIDIQALAPDQIVAKTIYSAISPGTEVAAYRGDPPLRPMKVYPRLLGYCNIAEVLAIGSKVSAVKVGEIILTTQSHRTHFVCQENKILLKVPAGDNLEHACTTYLFLLGYNALLRGNFVAGMNVAVIGLGTLGLTSIAVAHSLGANIVAFSDQLESLRLAMKFGASYVATKTENNIESEIQKLTHGTGIDLVISTSNSWKDWELALKIPRVGGTIAVLGFPGRTEGAPSFNPLSSQYFYDRQLHLVATGYTPNLDVAASDFRFTLKRNCEFILDLIRAERLSVEPFITARLPWMQLESFYKRHLQKEPGILTAVLDWRG